MFLIGTFVYVIATIIAVPTFIVLAYMAYMNNKYGEVITVFEHNAAGASGTIGILAVIYMFIAGFCIGDLLILWTSFLFVCCVIAGGIIGFIICKYLKFTVRGKIQYANVILADEMICKKIISCSEQMKNLKETVAVTATTKELKESGRLKVNQLQELLDKLAEIHQELQQQKIVLNAGLTTGEMKNIRLGSKKDVDRALSKELMKFGCFESLDDNLSDVRGLMKKYDI